MLIIEPDWTQPCSPDLGRTPPLKCVRHRESTLFVESLEKLSFIEMSSGLTSVPIAIVVPLLLPWGFRSFIPFPPPLSRNFVTRRFTGSFLTSFNFSDSLSFHPL